MKIPFLDIYINFSIQRGRDFRYKQVQADQQDHELKTLRNDVIALKMKYTAVANQPGSCAQCAHKEKGFCRGCYGFRTLPEKNIKTSFTANKDK